MFPLPSPPKLIEEKDKNTAVFGIEGLYPGYGTTIGNALRRVLFSSLEGAAVTRVKIKGVQHEFTTISGVLEDTVDICLSLKKLRFKLFSTEPQMVVLKVRGEKEVKGSDFEIPSQVELINKDAHIATLTSKGSSLEIELRIEKGTGYVPSELRDKEKLGIGEISLDAIYTPIKRVAFRVSNMRVEERTDYNKLQIEIETDGSITPKEALVEACNILVSHFSLVVDEFGKKPEKVKKEKKEEKKDKKEKKEKKEEVSVNEIKTEDLKLSSRTITALTKNNIKTVGGLLRKKADNFASIEGLGNKGVEEIKKTLKKIGVEI